MPTIKATFTLNRGDLLLQLRSFLDCLRYPEGNVDNIIEKIINESLGLDPLARNQPLVIALRSNRDEGVLARRLRHLHTGRFVVD
jgi:hypothetical protein